MLGAGRDVPVLPFNPFDKTRKAPSKRQNLKSKKGRAQLLVQETVHLFKVLDHPAFKSDPAGTIAQHLQNTFNPTPQ